MEVLEESGAVTSVFCELSDDWNPPFPIVALDMAIIDDLNKFYIVNLL